MDSGRSTQTNITSAVKNGPPSETVVRTVADVDDTDPADLPPLYEVVDPDALDALFRGRPSGTVTFDYGGYTVTVRGHAEVTVRK